MDRYSAKLFVVLLFLLVLSLLDAFFTLLLMQERNVIEINPFMATLLQSGVTPFIVIKFMITSIALFVFCLCKNFVVTRVFLGLVIFVYLTVILYEVLIMYTIPSGVFVLSFSR
ncbi:MAG: DUF5658 family protein [Nitrospirota bacterium]